MCRSFSDRFFVKRNAEKIIFLLAVLTASLVTVMGLWHVEAAGRMELQQHLAGEVLRFHVIANSDSDEDQELKLQVRDYGIGIDAGEENQIFRRFYRGRRVTRQDGFGIGLYLAREIINLHGGFMISKRMKPGLLLEMNLPV